MKTILGVATLAFLTASGACEAAGSLVAVTVIDRDSGAILTPHYSRGEYWVAGRPGARYAVQLRNNSPGRILAVTSVDGINVISGATAGWEQSGYVLGSGESYQVTGWRKSSAEVAAFTFTASPDSYAERTGRPVNVGVIGVAIFREQAAEPVAACCAESDVTRPHAPQAARVEAERSTDSSSPSVAAQAAGSAMREYSPKLGTGHGEREGSIVQQTQFVRLQREPNEVIRIRYDSLDNLVAMGIIRRPRPLLPQVNPFPESRAPQYVADPPG